MRGSLKSYLMHLQRVLFNSSFRDVEYFRFCWHLTSPRLKIQAFCPRSAADREALKAELEVLPPACLYLYCRIHANNLNGSSHLTYYYLPSGQAGALRLMSHASVMNEERGLIYSTRSFVGLDPWGLDPGAWKKPKLSKSEVNLKKVEKIHEKSKPVCEQSNR